MLLKTSYLKTENKGLRLQGKAYDCLLHSTATLTMEAVLRDTLHNRLFNS